MRHSSQRAFTLAELLIALSILGVIATFTIPKILSAQQDERYNAAGKEAMAMVAGAYQQAKLNNQISANTIPSDLSQYMNYVSVDTSTRIDTFQGYGTFDCTVADPCLNLHNGGKLVLTNMPFGGTSSTHVLQFYFDPDGRETDGTTNGPGKSLGILQQYGGRVTTEEITDPFCPSWTTCPAGPLAGGDPPWFHL